MRRTCAWSVAGVDTRSIPLWNPATGLPAAADVRQGATGDCWVLAALAALAHVHPERLKGLIRQRSNGRYAVTLRDREIDVGPVIDCWSWMNLVRTRPVNAANFHRVAWVAVMEKAMARREADLWGQEPTYEHITGGESGRMQKALGSSAPETVLFPPMLEPGFAEPALARVCAAVRDKRLVVVTLGAMPRAWPRCPTILADWLDPPIRALHAAR